MSNPLRRLAESRVLALVDQAIVSGASFAATVIVARFGGATDLASYSLATSILLLLVGAQNAIVILPYVIQRHHQGRDALGHAGSTLMLNIGLAAAAALVFVIAAATLSIASAGQATGMSLALAFAGPAVLAREFARRYAFAHLEMVRALQVDTATMVIQLSALLVLGQAGWLSAEAAIAAFGVACFVSAAGWFSRALKEFDLRLEGFGASIWQSWSLGRWLFANQIIGNLQGYASIWLSVLVLGGTATGIFAACVSIVAIANPLIFGLDNVLTPGLSAALAKGDTRELLGEALRNSALIGGLMTAVCAAIWFGGDGLMQLFYPSAEFSGYNDVLIVLVLATAALALTLPATSALAVTEKTRYIVLTGLVSLAVTVAAMVVLMQPAGLFGIALATLLGNLSCLVSRWVLLLNEMARRDTARSPSVSTHYSKA